VQDTFDRSVDDESWGAGVGNRAQRAPFHCSLSGCSRIGPYVAYPTATQFVASEHDTPNSRLSLVPASLGLGTTTHPEPSQRSVSVMASSCASRELPTAQHVDALAHDTSLRKLAVAPVGSAGGIRLQLAPSQCMATGGPVTNDASSVSPTARQLVALAHE